MEYYMKVGEHEALKNVIKVAVQKEAGLLRAIASPYCDWNDAELVAFVSDNYRTEPLVTTNNNTQQLEWSGKLTLQPYCWMGTTHTRRWTLSFSESHYSFLLTRYDDNNEKKGEIYMWDILPSSTTSSSVVPLPAITMLPAAPTTPETETLNEPVAASSPAVYQFELATKDRNYIIGTPCDQTRKKWCTLIKLAWQKFQHDEKALFNSPLRGDREYDRLTRLSKYGSYGPETANNSPVMYQYAGSWLCSALSLVGFPITNVLLPAVGTAVAGLLNPIVAPLTSWINQVPSGEGFVEFCVTRGLQYMDMNYGLPILCPMTVKGEPPILGQIVAVCMNEPLLMASEQIPVFTMFSLFVYYPKQDTVSVYSLVDVATGSTMQFLTDMRNRLGDCPYPHVSCHVKTMALKEIQEWRISQEKKVPSISRFSWSLTPDHIVQYGSMLEQQEHTTRNCQMSKEKKTAAQCLEQIHLAQL